MGARSKADRALLAEVRRLWGPERHALREAVKRGLSERPRFDRLARELRREARRPVGHCCMLFEEVEREPDDPTLDWNWIGDACWNYTAVLNREARSTMDLDRRLARHCGGTARLCNLWVSMVLPYFALDTSTLTYDRPGRWYEAAPLRPIRADDRRAVSAIRSTLRASGFRELPRRLEAVRLRTARTDLHKEGGATVFDCMCVDILGRVDERMRWSDDCHTVASIIGMRGSWKLWLDSRGRALRREVGVYLPSGDSLAIHTGDGDRVSSVHVYRPGVSLPVEFDVPPSSPRRPRHARR